MDNIHKMKIKILIWVFIVILLCPAVLSSGKVLTGSVELEFDVSGQMSNPRGLCVSNQAIWICSDTGTRTAYKYNMDGTYSGTSCATGTSSCTGIGCNSTHLFFSNRDGGKVVIKTWGCSAVTSFSSAGLRDVDVTADGSEIWVADENSDQIDLYENKAGYASLGSIALTGWDNAGTMFIGDYNSTIAYMIRGNGDLRTLGYFSRKSGDYLGEDTTSIFSSTDNIYGGDTNSTSGDNEGEYIRYWFINNSETNVYSVQVNVSIPPLPPAPPDEQTFTITATDTYDGSSLNNLTVTVFNSSNQFNYNTENGTIIISNKTGVVLAFNRSLYNLSIAVNDSGGYFNKSFGSINITDGGNFAPDLYQAVLYITAKDVLNNSVGDFLASVPLQNAQAQASRWEPGIICLPSTNCSGTSILYLRAQNYNITGNKTLAASMPNYGFLNTTSNITINAKDSVNIELEFYSNILTINATSIINNNKILNFDINTVGIDVTFNNIQSTTTGQIQLNLMGGNYNLSFGGVNYSNTYKVININSSDIRPNFTFTPYVYNSVNISIFDEILGRATNFFNSKIVNIELVSDIFSQNYTTTTGTFYADLLSPSDYRITYSSADYGKRDYYFNLENKTHNDIELYLLSNTNSTDITFTIVDNTGAAIENATINLKRYYVDTNSYRTVAMARTNVEGQGVIDTHFNNAFYQILAEKGSFFTNTIGAKIFTNTLTITIATTPDIFEDLDIVNNVLTNLTFNNNTGVFSYVFNHLAGTNVKGRLLVQRTESGKTETICDNSDTSSGATVLCPATIVGDKEYYKATGFIDTLTGNTEYITDVLDFDNWADTVLSTFKSSGVFLSIIFAGTIASLGLASPGISIAMFLVGLLGIVFFGFAPLSITIYISIGIIGGIIIYRLKS